MGVAGLYGWNIYSNSPLPLPLGYRCDQFLSGTATAPSFSLRFDIPLSDEPSDFYISPSLSYSDLRSKTTFGQFFTDTVSNGGVTERNSLEFIHTITSYTKGLGIGASIGWGIAKPLYVEIGAEALFLLNKKFDKILTPNGPGGFSNGSRDSLELSGDLPNTRSIIPAFTFSLGAEFPLSSKLSAAPTISAELPLLGTADYFSHYSIRGGITLRYDLSPRLDTITEYERGKIAEPIFAKVDTTHLPSKLSVAIEAYGRTSDGRQEKVIRIDVKDVRARVAFPFLNYVFFDEASSALPQRYVRYSSPDDAVKKFKGTNDRQGENILGIYKEMLNYLGARLKANPKTKITLTGSTSNTGSETNNLALARSRAETVKNYLANIWQIPEERMKIEARLLPERPSPLSRREGQEENRRVEITADDDRITDPIVVLNTEHLATPSKITLVPIITTDTGIAYVKATSSIGNKEILRYEGDINVFYDTTKAYTITEEALSSTEDILNLDLIVRDSSGNMATAHNTIPLKRTKTVTDRKEELERYSLILFGFDEDKLGGKNERTLSLVAKSFGKTNVRGLRIIGYTDEMGDVNYNDDLSRRRAKTASQELERALRNAGFTLPPQTIIDGHGSREKLYDNLLPEGRFFSRTVNITIEKGK